MLAFGLFSAGDNPAKYTAPRMNAFTVRAVESADAAAIQEIFAANIAAAQWLPPPARLHTDFARVSAGEAIFVAVDVDGRVAGFVAVQTGAAFIHHLHVRSEARGMGAGSALLASLGAWLPPPWRLKCVAANGAALAFYDRQGWVWVESGHSDDGRYELLTWQPQQVAAAVADSRPVHADIDKLAWLHIVDRRVLFARSAGKRAPYLPGGKRDPGETDEAALLREIREELSVNLDPGSLAFAGEFRAQADGKDEGTLVRMRCYRGLLSGGNQVIQAAAEIEEVMWLTHADRLACSAVGKRVLDWLKGQDLID